jgi:lipopolysaccharide heptosyltransferase I
MRFPVRIGRKERGILPLQGDSPSVPRILFVKTSSLGDVIHHCPAVSDAARAFPSAEIDWMVEEAFAAIPAMHAHVRRVIPVALRRWRAVLWHPSVWSEIGALRRALGAQTYDFVIDTQGLVKSAVLCSLASGAKHGMDRTSLREPFAARFYDVCHAVPRERHAVERNRQLTAAALGYSANGACDYALRNAGASSLDVRPPYAIFLTMTSRTEKLWANAHWSRLGGELSARGIRCVLPWGSESERVRCESIAREIPDAVVPSRLSLDALASLMRAARCAAGVDTGLTHLCAALGVPTIGIFCASDPALTGLYGSARARNLGAAGAPPQPDAVHAALEAVS